MRTLADVIKDATKGYKNDYKTGDKNLNEQLKKLELSTLLPGENLENVLKSLFKQAAIHRKIPSKTKKTLKRWMNTTPGNLTANICGTEYNTKNFGGKNSTSWTEELHAELIKTITAAQLNRERQNTLQDLIGTLSVRPSSVENQQKYGYDKTDCLSPGAVALYIERVNEKIENFNNQYPQKKLISIKIPSTLDVKRSVIDSESRETICSELECELKKLEK